MKPGRLAPVLLTLGALSCGSHALRENAAAGPGATVRPFTPVGGAAPPALELPRTPAPSPDGRRVAFGHQGDIWVASVEDGMAVRITAHDAYETSPRWSPDGKWLAFVSTRHGNPDVFIVPAAGGTPQRLTWNSESELVQGWIDQDRILISATRERRYSRRGQGAWVAWRDGRTPTLLGDWPMQRPAMSPHGRWLAYERGHGDPRRRAYRGSASSALWVCDLQNGTHHALTEGYDGNDLNPMWGGDGAELYFLSDRPCPGNEDGRELGLWRIPRRGGDAELVYHPGDHSLRTAQISLDGTTVIAEIDDGLVVIDTASGSARDLVVRGSYDPSEPLEEEVTVDRASGGLAVSPDGESVAFEAQGDIFVMRKHEKIRRAARVTTDPALDSNPVWSEDGHTLYFVSERDGNGEIYRVRPENWVAPKEPEKVEEETEGKETEGKETEGKETEGKETEGKETEGKETEAKEKAAAEEEPEIWPFYRKQAFSVERLTRTAEDESALTFSPDFEHAAWVVGAGRLVVGDPETFAIAHTLTDGFEAPSYEWAPDSAWIAWSQPDDDFNYEVFLAKVAPEEGDPAARPINVSQHPDDDTGPHWSPDGRLLAWTGRRMLNDETDVWMAFLHKADWERNERERLEAQEAREKERKSKARNGGKKEDEDEKEKAEPVTIDLTDLHRRVRRVTRREGNESALGFDRDSSHLYFNATTGTRLTTDSEAETGFFQVDVYEGDEERLEPRPVSSLLRHGKEILYLRGGQVVGRTGKATSYDFSVDFRRDRRAFRKAVVEQAWRALDRNFYDPGFHGHDWAASLRRWEPIALAASTPEDFASMMNWMLGEMNASHMGYYRAGTSRAAAQDVTQTAVLGVIWDEEFPGPGRRIREVLPETPASRADSLLRAGDVVLAVDGERYEPGDNWYRLMAAKAEQETRLLVRNSEGEERDVFLRPARQSTLGQALYRRFVLRTRAEVEESSGGRLGYVHIQAMGTGSLLDFERELFEAGHGKDVLLIDVRENGGGWTTDMVLTMLTAPRHAITVPRGGGEGYPQGRRIFAAWEKPVVVLCNENSYSNAEIFSWSIKTIGRGPLVGKRTYGAVISTGGMSLLDGSFVRLPFRGWYVNDGQHTPMELNGCPPDYPVEILPADFAAERDPQIAKAIEVGLELAGG